VGKTWRRPCRVGARPGYGDAVRIKRAVVQFDDDMVVDLGEPMTVTEFVIFIERIGRRNIADPDAHRYEGNEELITTGTQFTWPWRRKR